MPDPSDIWARCLLSIENKISRQSFQTWFSPIHCVHFDEGAITLQVPSAFFADWLEEYYSSIIKATLQEETDRTIEIRFTIAEEKGPQPPSFSDPPARSPQPEAGPQMVSDAISHLNPRYTFDTFVVGTSNQFAHAAAMAVADAPGRTAFNPLVVYGGVGLGKTHILQAIGHYCLKQGTARDVIYIPSEKFFTDFIRAVQTHSTAKFTQYYRSADVLLVDDIQFFLTTEMTQRELFHTFNTLHQNQKQIVLSSDCPPGQLIGMEERLISRFQWGLVAGIDPPDFETRVAILNRKAESDDIALPEEIAAFIASSITSNIRELEGALIRLLAHCSIKGKDLTLEVAKEVLQTTTKGQGPEITIESIQRRVAEYFQIPLDLIIGKTRKQEVAVARHVAMYLSKRLTTSPLRIIGLHFGGRDHSTVVHACQIVETKMDLEPNFANLIDSLSNTIVAENIP